MDFAEIFFVVGILLVSLWAVLLVRRAYLDTDLAQEDKQRKAETDERRRRGLGRSHQPQSRQ